MMRALLLLLLPLFLLACSAPRSETEFWPAAAPSVSPLRHSLDKHEKLDTMHHEKLDIIHRGLQDAKDQVKDLLAPKPNQ